MGDARLARAAAVARAAWPLAALLGLAAAVRFSTLSEQSFWYDEAYTPVHVLHAGLGATLSAMVHSENSPPVWYVLIWIWAKVLGTGVFALRSLSALAGVALVAVAWSLGRELGTRTTAIVLAAIVAFNPLFVWYSQEARVYELFALAGALSLLFFLRARRGGGAGVAGGAGAGAGAGVAGGAATRTRDLVLWSATSILALATHYFAIFLVVPEALVLLADARRAGQGTHVRRATVLAAGALAVCAAALVPLVIAQGGHGTQWIGAWALSSRLVAIPGYFLLGGQSTVFGHIVLLACAAPILVALALVPSLYESERRRGVLVLALGALSISIPFAMAIAGADYLAPRNLIASWVPLAAALAVALTARRSGRPGLAIAGLVCAAGLAVVVAIDLTPRYQRGDWSGVARALVGGSQDRAVVTVELGSAPLEYYRPGLRYLSYGHEVRVSEVDLVGYAPLRGGAPHAPTAAFHPVSGRSVHGLLVYRYVAATPQLLSETQLRRATITDTTSEVLVPGSVASIG